MNRWVLMNTLLAFLTMVMFIKADNFVSELTCVLTAFTNICGAAVYWETKL